MSLNHYDFLYSVSNADKKEHKVQNYTWIDCNSWYYEIVENKIYNSHLFSRTSPTDETLCGMFGNDGVSVSAVPSLIEEACFI